MENKFLFVEEENFNKIRKIINESKGKRIVFKSSDDELNRKVLEKLKIDFLLISLSGRKDFQKQRNSGFDNVMAKLASEKDVTIGIDLDEVINSIGEEKAKILSRIIQNIKLSKKNFLKMKFFPESKKNKYDLRSLGLVLGMTTKMVKLL